MRVWALSRMQRRSTLRNTSVWKWIRIKRQGDLEGQKTARLDGPLTNVQGMAHSYRYWPPPLCASCSTGTLLNSPNNIKEEVSPFYRCGEWSQVNSKRMLWKSRWEKIRVGTRIVTDCRTNEFNSYRRLFEAKDVLLLACGSPHFFHAFLLLTFKKQSYCSVCDTIIIVKLPAMLPSEKALKNTPTPSSQNRSRFTTDHHLQSRAICLCDFCEFMANVFKNLLWKNFKPIQK